MYYNSDIDDIKNNLKIKWVNILISFCKGLIYAVFSPFIWSINSYSQLMVYPQVIFWWGIIPFIIYGIIWSIRFKRNETALMIFFIGSVYSVLSITEGNIGSVFRHRDWVTPLCFIFGAVGINKFIFCYRYSNKNLAYLST